MKKLVCALGLLLAAASAGRAAEPPAPTAIDRAFNRMYNLDFAGAHAILDEELRAHPENPLIYSVQGAAYLFSEFDRLNILEIEFFENDDKVTDRKKVKPDPVARARLLQVTAEARKIALARLAVEPNDANAMFALCMAAGVETDYAGLVEKKYLRTYSLSKEAQGYARKLLAMQPPCYDAYLTLGAVEYVVSNLNFFYRLFIRFDQIEGSKAKAEENLKKVVEGGRYYPPFARILLSVIYLREDKVAQALALLKEMEKEYPGNRVIQNEVRRATAKVALPTTGRK